MDKNSHLKKQPGRLPQHLQTPHLHAAQVERHILGGMLLDEEAMSIALEKLEPADFYLEAHQLMFTAMHDMNSKNVPVDTMTLVEELRKTKLLEKIGDEEFLVELSSDVVTSANIASHCKIIREKSVIRQVMRSCVKVQEICLDGEKESEEILDAAESYIYQVSEKQVQQNFFPIKDVLRHTFELIEKYSRGEVRGVPSGYPDLDDKTGGFQSSDLIILAGRPSMGKTALALNFIAHAAINTEKSIAIFSLEMGKEQLVQRLLCKEAKISLQLMRTGKLPRREYPVLLDKAGLLNKTKIFIDDSASQTAMQIRSKCRRLSQLSSGLDMVVIDYLQLMSGSGGRREENRQQEIAQISRALKGLAKELNIPVIALSQLNRSVESRGDGRPMLSDLRESGALEQDADVVMFIYRPEVYNHDDASLEGKAEVIVAKQRNGPIGKVDLFFRKEYAAFENYSSRLEKDGF